MVTHSNKKIIFCNSLTLLKRSIYKYDGKGKYVLLNCNKLTFRIKRFLDDSKKYDEISIKEFSSWKDQYEKKFVDLVASVNVANHKQHFWWGLNFTNKTSLITPLSNKVFYALFIAKIIEEDFEGERLFIIGKDNDIFKQLKIWFEGKDIELKTIRSLRLQKDNLKDEIREYTPIAVFFAALRSFIRKMQVGRIKFDAQKEHTVALSFLNHQSFRPDGSYCDTYFGEFVPYAADKDAPLINLFFVNSPHYGKMMRKIQEANTGFIMMPLEFCLSTLDIMKCLLISLRRYFFGISLIGNYSIDGKNVNHLINTIIRRDFRATYFFDNIRIYYEIKNFVKKVPIKKFYYPYENQAYEKLVLIALKRFVPKAKAVGYQYPALASRDTNFLLTKQEADIIPLPDKIMTMGEVTKNYMSKRGNFPDRILTRGCALRQRPHTGNLKKKRMISNLVVLLATNLEEYIKVIDFLNKALGHQPLFTIWMRPHPVFSLPEAIAIAGKPYFPFYESGKESMNECLEWADIALYAATTASLEALSRGLPVICLDIDNTLNSDPLTSFTDFRWKVSSPEDLTGTIEGINSLSEDEYYARQKRATEYTKEYLYPVNERNMDIFLQV